MSYIFCENGSVFIKENRQQTAIMEKAAASTTYPVIIVYIVIINDLSFVIKLVS